MLETFALFGLSPENILQTGGILLVAAIVFAESGLLVGFFLPGDTLLFATGLYASQGRIPYPLPVVLLIIVIAAIAGDNVGYSFGRRMGNRVFKKQDGIFFRQEYIEKAEAFYEKHGGKTIIIARFTPIVRSFAPIVAGAGKMPRRKFMAYNVVGGVLWGAGMTLLGYFVGSKIPGLDKYIEYVMVVVIGLSFLLAFSHVLKDKKTRTMLMAKIKLTLSNLFLNKKVD